jgi:hypothetical protein
MFFNQSSQKDFPSPTQINSLISHYCWQIEESNFKTPSPEHKLLLKLEWLYAAVKAISRYLRCPYMPSSLSEIVNAKMIFDADNPKMVKLYDKLRWDLMILKPEIAAYIGGEHIVNKRMQTAIESLENDCSALPEPMLVLNDISYIPASNPHPTSPTY